MLSCLEAPLDHKMTSTDHKMTSTHIASRQKIMSFASERSHSPKQDNVNQGDHYLTSMRNLLLHVIAQSTGPKHCGCSRGSNGNSATICTQKLRLKHSFEFSPNHLQYFLQTSAWRSPRACTPSRPTVAQISLKFPTFIS